MAKECYKPPSLLETEMPELGQVVIDPEDVENSEMVLFFCSSSLSSLISRSASSVSFKLSLICCFMSSSKRFTACDASFSFLRTSFSFSCSRFSLSTFATRFAKDISWSMRSPLVSSSQLCTWYLSACIFCKLPCTLGFSFKFRQRLLLLSFKRCATLWISVWVSLKAALLHSPFSWLRVWMSSSYLRSRSRCSWIMREISSPMNCVSAECLNLGQFVVLHREGRRIAEARGDGRRGSE